MHLDLLFIYFSSLWCHLLKWKKNNIVKRDLPFENYIFFLSTGWHWGESSFHGPWVPFVKESIMGLKQWALAGSYSKPSPRKWERESEIKVLFKVKRLQSKYFIAANCYAKFSVTECLLKMNDNRFLPNLPSTSSHHGGDIGIGTASGGLWAIGFHRDKGDELVGSSSLKRADPEGLVGLQRCRLKKHIWVPLAEFRWALDIYGCFYKDEVGKTVPPCCLYGCLDGGRKPEGKDGVWAHLVL